MDKLRQLGGVSGLANTVQSHAHHGLDPSVASGPTSIEEHRRVFGANTMPPMAQKNFFMLCFENIQDPIILLLIAAALVRSSVQAFAADSSTQAWQQCRGHVAGDAGGGGCRQKLVLVDSEVGQLACCGGSVRTSSAGAHS